MSFPRITSGVPPSSAKGGQTEAPLLELNLEPKRLILPSLSWDPYDPILVVNLMWYLLLSNLCSVLGSPAWCSSPLGIL